MLIGAMRPVAYLVPETVEHLTTIDDHPKLASLHVPRGMYTSARISKARPKDPTSLISANGISISIADSKARYPSSFAYFENQITTFACSPFRSPSARSTALRSSLH